MPSEKQFQSNARKLRNEMTKQERHLWYDFLRNFEIQFYRQKVIENYIVDFYCARAKVVVELDGGQHFEDADRSKDHRRDERLKSLFFKSFFSRSVLPKETIMECLPLFVEHLNTYMFV